MPKIIIHNFDRFLLRVMKGENALKEELTEKYRQAIDTTAVNIAQGAVEMLNKPSWQLSAAIRASRLKEYKESHTFFQAVEPENSLNPKPNTPAAYAFYHEHGYVVQLSKVSRPRPGKAKGIGKKASYRRTEGKHFFRDTANVYFPRLENEIHKINEETKLKLED